MRKKKAKIPSKYTAGIKGKKKTELENVIRKISSLYKAGKRVPKSLIEKRLKLGRKKKSTK